MQDSAESGFIDIDNTNKPININYEESKTSAAPRPASASAPMMQSCLDDDDNNSYVICPSSPKALVTVCPTANGGFTMVLDDKTTLVPSNMDKSPFGNKEVRALVCYTPDKSFYDGTGVTVNRIDSIRTKLPAIDLGDKNDETYGNDPIEIVKDWVTVAEDGYLTLRVRTITGPRTHSTPSQPAHRFKSRRSV